MQNSLRWFLIFAFPEQETHFKETQGAVLELPDWKKLLKQFKEGPQDDDPKRTQDFILFNRLALMAMRKDWWALTDRGVEKKTRNLHKAFTASDFAFALIMFGNWSADSEKNVGGDASSSTSGASVQEGSIDGGHRNPRMKRKKVLCGEELASAIQDYHDTYEGLREYWRQPEKRALVKKWNKVIENHDEERIVKCRGQKRKEVGPGPEDKKAKLVNFSLMEDFDSHGKGDLDDEAVVPTTVTATNVTAM